MTSLTIPDESTASSLGSAVPPAQPFANVRRLWEALDIRRQRRALLLLDDRMLRDVGLSRADVEREVTRALFDLPSDLRSR